MAVENVNGDVSDPSYRYKMPRITVKVEGRGNGIRTAFPNISAVAVALNRFPLHLLRYFGIELCANIKYDEKSKIGIVNGNHSWEKIHDVLMKFIKGFVLCLRCKNPETEMEVQKNNLELTCKACGYSFKAPPGDKLTKIIITEKRQQKKSGKIVQDDDSEEVEREGNEEEDEDDEDVKAANIKRKEEKKRMKIERSKKKNEERIDDEKNTDTENQISEQSKRRKGEKDEKNEKDGIAVDSSSSSSSSSSSTSSSSLSPSSSILSSSSSLALPNISVEIESGHGGKIAKMKELEKVQTGLRLNVCQKDHPMMEVFDGLFPITVCVAMLELKVNVEKLIRRKGEMGQFSIIVALERLVAVKNRTLLDTFPVLLNTLYHTGVLEDDKVFIWYTHPILTTTFGVPEIIARETRAKAAQFIEYLTVPDDVVATPTEEEAKLVEEQKNSLDKAIDDL